jgi:hypothetical protein
VEQVKGLACELYYSSCLNQMGCSLNFAVWTNNPKFRETRNIHLFTVDYGLYPLYPHTTARNVAMQSYNVTKTFHGNLYNVKHMYLYCGTWSKPWYIQIRSVAGCIISRFHCIPFIVYKRINTVFHRLSDTFLSQKFVIFGARFKKGFMKIVHHWKYHCLLDIFIKVKIFLWEAA